MNLSDANLYLDEIFANPYSLGAIVLFLSLYAGRAVPVALPSNVMYVIQHTAVRFLVMYVLAFSVTRNALIAGVSTGIFYLIMLGGLVADDVSKENFVVEEFETEE